MKLVVISGTDDVLVNQTRDRVVAATLIDPERLDISEDSGAHLVDLLGALSLFGEGRHGLVDHLEADGGSGLTLLETHAQGSDAVVVACWRGRLGAAHKRRIEALGELVQAASVGKAAEQVALVKSLGKEAGLSLSSGVESILAGRLGEDPGRLSSVIEQLADAGILSPTEAQVSLLCGSANKDRPAWDVTDAVAAGRPVEAIHIAQEVPAILLASWLGGESLRMLRILEGGLGETEAASVLKIHPFRAKKLVRWAEDLGYDKLRQSCYSAVRLDLAAKGGDEAALLAATAQWVADLS